MKVYYHATLLHLLKDYYYRIAMRNHFQIRKLGNRTTTWNITRFIDEIFRDNLLLMFINLN